MAKTLTEYQKEERKNSSYYFKNGKPKKYAMLCKNKEYIKEITQLNGIYDINWACGGSNCPLYAAGCDNRGRDWE